MAAIHEELTLADRFSATFTRYLGMLRQSTGASAAAAAGQRQFHAASGGAKDALSRMAEAALDAASAMGDVDGSAAQAAAARIFVFFMFPPHRARCQNAVHPTPPEHNSRCL